MNNKLISMSIGATVAIILLATLLVPTVSDAVEGHTTIYTNPGLSASQIDLESDHLITLNNSTRTLVVDGVSTPYSSWGAVLVSDVAAIRAFADNVALYGVKPDGSYCTFSATTLTITISSGVATFSNGSTSYDLSPEWMYVVDANSTDYVMGFVNSAVSLNLESIDQLHANWWGSNKFASCAGADVELLGVAQTATYTTSEVTDGVIGLAFGNGGDYSIDVGGVTTYPAQYVAPAKISIDTDPAMSSLLLVLPVLIILAIVVYLARSFGSRAD